MSGRHALRHREFRLLWTAQIVSETGDFIARVAIAGLLYQRTGSAALTALATVVIVLPWAAGPFLSARLDFLPHRSTMLISDASRMILMTAVAFSPNTLIALLLALAAGLLTPPFDASRHAVLAEAVREERAYIQARMISAITYQSTSLVGLFAGGMLLVHLGAETALLVNAAAYGVSFLLIAGLRVGRRSHRVTDSMWETLRAGGRAVWNDRLVRRAGFLPIWGMAGATAAEALVVGFAGSRNALGSVGLLAATVPAATLLTSAAISRFLSTDHRGLLRMSHVVVMAGSAVTITGFAVPRNTVTDVLAFAGAGITFGAVAPLISVVGLRLPLEAQSSAYSLLQSGLRLGEAVVAGSAAALTAYLGVVPALIAISAVSVVLTGAGVLRLPQQSAGSATHAKAPA